ncbi:MAG TPA: DUF721 domain-containing protein [Gaiellaceae bacterium]|jgi:hypothetical protein|nr:DUF721 domain-containing protein [Gaiellaceae bacterium]
MDRIGDAVRSELGRFGTAGEMAELVAVWPQAVGETVARNAWPARLTRDRTLHVNASSSAWAFELQQLESEIAGRLQEVLDEGTPRKLRFVPGPLPEAAPAAEERRATRLPEATLEQVREARDWAAGIESEDLRKSVEKAARASLARAAADRAV